MFNQEIKNENVYNIFPQTYAGKISLGIFFLGLLIFLSGVILGSTGNASASLIAVTGMVVYFAGGLMRAYTN